MSKNRQAGLSMSGFLLWCVILSIGALLAFKLVPAYMENQTIQKHLRAIASDSNFASGNRKEIELAFEKRAGIDRIDAISAKELEIEKGAGGISLSATYTTRIPLVYNISACMDFNPRSK